MSSSSTNTDSEHIASTLETFLDSKLRAQIVGDFERRDRTIQAILPCTPLQEAMLSASLDSSVAAYYNRTLFRLSGDVSQMKQCWELMVARHGILRTAFAGDRRCKVPLPSSSCLQRLTYLGRSVWSKTISIHCCTQGLMTKQFRFWAFNHHIS